MNNKNKRKTIISTCVLAGVLLAASCTAMTSAISPKADGDDIARYILNQLAYDENNFLSTSGVLYPQVIKF